jgi:hypothetical protein
LFNHTFGSRPRIVIWYHEKSSEGNPFVELVADDFETFLSELRESQLMVLTLFGLDHKQLTVNHQAQVRLTDVAGG